MQRDGGQDRADDQKPGKFMRGASGKARPRSSSPTVHFQARPGPARAQSQPPRTTPPASSASGGAGKTTEELVLIRLAGLTSRDTASKAWAALSGALPVGVLPVGVLALVKVVLLPVHDYITLEHRTLDDVDEAHRALEASAIEYHNKKGHVLKAVPIRCKPLAMRRRGNA